MWSNPTSVSRRRSTKRCVCGGAESLRDRPAYTRFLQNLVKERNLTRQVRWAEEQAALRPLPASWLALCRELRVRVSRFSTIQVLRNTYSVPSRLIGTKLLVRVRSEVLEVYRGTVHLLSMPRLLGIGQHRIDYRHVIWSLGTQAWRLCPVPLPR